MEDVAEPWKVYGTKNNYLFSTREAVEMVLTLIIERVEYVQKIPICKDIRKIIASLLTLRTC